MKVFISHAFGGEDERLGSILKADLDAADMDGYMAERAPKYNRMIADKIKQEIEKSDWLVAVITKRGQASASVHEEIGYALGLGVEVMLMVKKGVEGAGVLVHGREPLVFTPGEFKKCSLEAVNFIKSAPAPRPRRSLPGEDVIQLLTDRNVASEDSPLFAQNMHFGSLHSPVPDDAEKPVALFTAYPHELAAADVTSEEFVEWAETTTSIDVDGQRVRVPGFDRVVAIGALRFFEKRPHATRGRDVLMYREFQANGFYELGTSHIFFGKNDEMKPRIHLCYMIGEFWAFLAYARLFYEQIGLNGPLTALLSIRNSRNLALGNFGDEVVGRSTPPIPPQFPRSDPATACKNIQLSCVFGSVGKMTDDAIAQAAKKAAKEVCNAYGEIVPRCYDKNGNFSWKLWKIVARGALSGGRT